MSTRENILLSYLVYLDYRVTGFVRLVGFLGFLDSIEFLGFVGLVIFQGQLLFWCVSLFLKEVRDEAAI